MNERGRRRRGNVGDHGAASPRGSRSRAHSGRPDRSDVRPDRRAREQRCSRRSRVECSNRDAGGHALAQLGVVSDENHGFWLPARPGVPARVPPEPRADLPPCGSPARTIDACSCAARCGRANAARVVQRQVLTSGRSVSARRGAVRAVLDETASARQLALFPADRAAPALDCEGCRSGSRTCRCAIPANGATAASWTGSGDRACRRAGRGLAGRVEGAGLLPAHRSGERLRLHRTGMPIAPCAICWGPTGS